LYEIFSRVKTICNICVAMFHAFTCIHMSGEIAYACDIFHEFCHEVMTLITLCLQRFENIYGGKIDRHVHFEERLCLAGYMCRAGKVCLFHMVLLVYSMWLLSI